MLDLNDVKLVQPRERFDLDEIVHRLRAAAETWVPRHFPNGRREGDEWRLANIRGDAPRKNGSCVIALKGPHAGDWYDHDGGSGGGPLSTLENATGLSGRELFAHAAEEVGWASAAPARREPPPSSKEKDSQREIAIILSRASSIAGTLAETYLRSRGLAVPQCDDLLFHPDLAHWETKAGWPALIGVVRDCKNEVVGLHRIYLRPDGATKAEITHPKKMLGKVSGGAARLAAIRDDGRLGLCEGIETGLAVMTAAPDLPVWATLSTSHLEQVVLPPEAREVIILADNDSSGAGLRAAETIARKLKAEGRKAAICQPPRADTDFNDLLMSDGPGAVADLVRAALVDLAEREAEEPVMGRHLPFGFALPSPPLPNLRADEGDLSRAGNKAWSLLLASNRRPWLFRAGGVPSWIVPDDEGRPMAAALGEERLRYMLARLANWRRIGRSNEFVPAAPPTGLVKSLLATPDPALPVLAGIVATPVFGRNGSLLTEPGYHAEAKLLYHPEPGFQLPSIPGRPKKDDIAQASALILDDLLGDFPFVSDSERAHAVALLLLGFVRAMIDGPTPLHLIEKPEAGTGAGLMIDIIATIVTGRAVSVMTASDNDEEWRKRITAKLRQMPAMAVIDNINSEIDSAALAAALTAPFWEDRILGVSEIVRIPIRCVWVATGNNPQFSREIARRIVRIRLDAKRDRPWLRSGFRHPDLMSWVRANRPRLVAACLLLGTAWIAAGKPAGVKNIGSFEAWSRIIGGILDVAGVDGFLGNLDELMAASDAEGAIWRGLVAAWWDRFGTAEVGTSDLYELALSSEPPLPLGAGGDRSQRTRLGKAVGKMRDRVFDLEGRSVRIVTAGLLHNSQRWTLQLQEGSAPDAAACGDIGMSPANVPTNVPTKRSSDINGFGDVGDVGDVFPTPAYTRARTRAHEEEGGEKRPQRPQCPQEPSDRLENSGGRCGGHSGEAAQRPPAPDWLKEVL